MRRKVKIMTVLEQIQEQQNTAPAGSVAWCVAEDLKAICAADPHCAAIVAEDLRSKSMSIFECAKKNQANADRVRRERKGACVRIPQSEEERIIREFYGLPPAGAEAVPEPDSALAQKPLEEDGFDFSAFL